MNSVELFTYSNILLFVIAIYINMKKSLFFVLSTTITLLSITSYIVLLYIMRESEIDFSVLLMILIGVSY